MIRTPPALPKLYSELASWWPLMSPPSAYAEEAALYAALLSAACHPKSVLELGSGGGNNASHLKKLFEMTLVELSPEMLEVSLALNPECTHLRVDMRSARLEVHFDAVFIQDALSYMTSTRDLHLALETAFAHCREGGAGLFAPDWFRETFEPGSRIGGCDGDGDGRSLRYIEWTHDPDPSDTTVETDFAFLLRDAADGEIRVVADHHTCGLFERDLWLDLCHDVGFEPEIRRIRPARPEDHETEVILCHKPAPG
jgi:SAM-dependent methyltransferase